MKTVTVMFKGRKEYQYLNCRSYRWSWGDGRNVWLDEVSGCHFPWESRAYRYIDSIIERSQKVYLAYGWVLGHRVGLDRWIRLLKIEERVLDTCLGMRPQFEQDGVPHRLSSKAIYDDIGFGKIDVFMMNMGLRFSSTFIVTYWSRSLPSCVWIH